MSTRTGELSVHAGEPSTQRGELSVQRGEPSTRMYGLSVWSGELSPWRGGLSTRRGEPSVRRGEPSVRTRQLFVRRRGPFTRPCGQSNRGGETSAWTCRPFARAGELSGAEGGGRSCTRGNRPYKGESPPSGCPSRSSSGPSHLPQDRNRSPAKRAAAVAPGSEPRQGRRHRAWGFNPSRRPPTLVTVMSETPPLEPALRPVPLSAFLLALRELPQDEGCSRHAACGNLGLAKNLHTLRITWIG